MYPAPLPTPLSQPAGSGGLSATDLRDLAERVFGTARAADFWMDRRNPELGDATPNQLIAAGRAQVVKDFLEALFAGNFG